MTFAHPEYFWFLLGLPLVALVLVRAMRKRDRLFAGYVGAADTSRGRIVRWLRIVACVLGLACLLAALAEPVADTAQTVNLKRDGAALMVALDCSKSMLAEDVKPNRLERAKREAIDLTDRLSGDKVGLVAFAGDAFVQCPLTLDYSAFRLFLSVVGPNYFPVGGSNLAQAVDVALEAFSGNEGAGKAIIVISDGEETTEENEARMQDVAEKAKSMGIRIYTMGVGTTQGAPVPSAKGYMKTSDGSIVVSKLDDGLLKKIATITGGLYVDAVGTDDDLDVLYDKTIRRDMTRTTFEETRQQRRTGDISILVLVALGLFAFVFARPGGYAGRWILVLALVMGIRCPVWAMDTTDIEHLAQQAYEAERYDEALALYLKAQIENPTSSALYYNIGNAQYRLGHFKEAATQFAEALRQGTPDLQAQAAYNLGNARFKNHDIGGAIEAYETALRLNPNDTDAAKNLAFAKQVQQQQKQQQEQQGSSSQEQQQQEKSEQQGDSSQNQGTPNNSGESNSSESPGQSGTNTPSESSAPSEQTGGEKTEQHDNASSKNQNTDQTSQSQNIGESHKQDPEKQNDMSSSQDERHLDNGEEASAPDTASSDSEAPLSERLQAIDGEGEQGDDENTEAMRQTAVAGKSDEPSETSTESADQRVGLGVLDRLQDMPGGALRPTARKQQVTKDW
ncbi:vWA domain-containing protein [Desulfovibrio inopinatus]|uniref:vWA domain-containing protein n=1 Tax=Desulfovibrio inopinatus TaxID=102109 RepID=UPI000421A319|nr:VWA domain-containing protein [Desulfovibrio inopinatus]